MKQTSKKKWCIVILIVILVAIASGRIIWINNRWPQTQDIIIPMGEPFTDQDVSVEVLDSVLGSAKETLQYYGRPSDEISEDEVLTQMPYGWHGYVMAVKMRITNHSAEDIYIGECLFPYVESLQWHNGYDMFVATLFNENNASQICSGETIDLVFPCMVYQEHFRDKEWKDLPNREFYLSKPPLYPTKTMLVCTPKFLPSVQMEFDC